MTQIGICTEDEDTQELTSEDYHDIMTAIDFYIQKRTLTYKAMHRFGYLYGMIESKYKQLTRK